MIKTQNCISLLDILWKSLFGAYFLHHKRYALWRILRFLLSRFKCFLLVRDQLFSWRNNFRIYVIAIFMQISSVFYPSSSNRRILHTLTWMNNEYSCVSLNICVNQQSFNYRLEMFFVSLLKSVKFSFPSFISGMKLFFNHFRCEMYAFRVRSRWELKREEKISFLLVRNSSVSFRDAGGSS